MPCGVPHRRHCLFRISYGPCRCRPLSHRLGSWQACTTRPTNTSVGATMGTGKQVTLPKRRRRCTLAGFARAACDGSCNQAAAHGYPRQRPPRQPILSALSCLLCRHRYPRCRAFLMLGSLCRTIQRATAHMDTCLEECTLGLHAVLREPDAYDAVAPGPAGKAAQYTSVTGTPGPVPGHGQRVGVGVDARARDAAMFRGGGVSQASWQGSGARVAPFRRPVPQGGR